MRIAKTQKLTICERNEHFLNVIAIGTYICHPHLNGNPNEFHLNGEERATKKHLFVAEHCNFLRKCS